MTVYAITDTKKGRTGIAPTYLQTTRYCFHRICLRVNKTKQNYSSGDMSCRVDHHISGSEYFSRVCLFR